MVWLEVVGWVQVGFPLTFEQLEGKRASRIAAYHPLDLWQDAGPDGQQQVLEWPRTTAVPAAGDVRNSEADGLAGAQAGSEHAPAHKDRSGARTASR